MPLSAGLVGLTNAGKSTLFNALTKKQLAQVANRPFTTIEPNIGVVEVPDERLFRLRKVVESSKSQAPIAKQIPNSADPIPKTIPATLKVVDIAGLVKDAHKSVGLGNQFLAHIRQVDLIIYVIRAFDDPAIVHPAGRVKPQEDLGVLKLELELADLNHQSRTTNHEESFLLSAKPSIVVLNVSESQLNQSPTTFGLPSDTLVICAKIEAELAGLSSSEQLDYLRLLGYETASLEGLLKLAYRKLGLITFYTFNEKELRAWPVKQGTSVSEAAGKIHTDMQRGFIAVEVIQWDKLIETGSWKEAKDKGWVRLEGKDYLVQDGDVILVRFNL